MSPWMLSAVHQFSSTSTQANYICPGSIRADHAWVHFPSTGSRKDCCGFCQWCLVWIRVDQTTQAVEGSSCSAAGFWSV